MYKKVAIIFVVLTLGALAIYFIWQKAGNIMEEISMGFIKPSTKGWQTFIDSSSGISFLYPEVLAFNAYDSGPAEYIHPEEWPPKAEILDKAFSCVETSSETVKTRNKIINGETYCVTEKREGAAGSIYASYSYASLYKESGRTAVIEFTLRLAQCGNYNDPQKSLCEKERSKFGPDIDNTLDGIMGSIKLSD